MTEDEFRNALVDLIDRARSAETISLEDLTSIIDAELEGLNMALKEGEQW